MCEHYEGRGVSDTRPFSNQCEGSGMLPPAPEVETLGVSTAVSAVVVSDSISTLPGELSLPLYRNSQVLKRILKASRHLAALALILDSVTECNNDVSWDRHLNSVSSVLQYPKELGSGHVLLHKSIVKYKMRRICPHTTLPSISLCFWLGFGSPQVAF